MMKDHIIRKATAEDIPFLTESVIEAEKSGTSILSYSTLFGITEEETRKYVSGMLMEETDGCELSVSSFLIAENDKLPMAGVAAWVENAEGISSNMLKRNLLNYALPKNCFERAAKLSPVVQAIYIKEEPGTIQIGMVYVSAAFRGLNLARILIDEQVKRLSAAYPAVSKVCVQVFGNNEPAIRVYRNAGFQITEEKICSDKEVWKYFPSDRKILMEKPVSQS